MGHEAPQAAAGTSSFGMSGVNAHAIFLAPSAESPMTDECDAESAGRLTWRCARHWAAPVEHRLLRGFSAGGSSAAGGACMFQADLSASALAFLHDHQVPFVGPPLFQLPTSNFRCECRGGLPA